MGDPYRPTTPVGAYDAFLPRALEKSRERRPWEQSDGPLPALYLCHGSPALLDNAAWLEELFAWGQSMPQPRGILIVSAHWENAPLAISATKAGTSLYYDFTGFHPRYYTLKYATPDAAGLARQVVGTLASASPLHQHVDRGLDHGAFIPLMAMYPAADVPVMQLSLPTLDPAPLLHLGRRLRALRDEGILVVGSGFITHGLPERFDSKSLSTMAPVHAEFDAWAAEALARGDIDTLADFRAKGPATDRVHRTTDHYVPLLVALGAGDDAASGVTTAIEGVAFSNSKRSIQVA